MLLDTVFNFFTRGGIFMYPLAFCSIISLSVILERGFALLRGKIIDVDLANAIQALRHGQKPERIERMVLDERSVLARLVRNCLQNLPWSKFENTEALQTKARAEISRMERGLVVLEIMVGIGPLLGLMGTVTGLITIFGNVGDQSVSTAGVKIAAGIAEALNTTVAGLVVAIPSMIAYSIYTRWIEGLSVEMESICVDLLTKLYTEATEPSVGTSV